MQDKYACDVGDVGKFVLLDQLVKVSAGRLRLGINWYRVTRPERSNADGRHISYLERGNPAAEKFERCNPRIYSSLKSLVDVSNRSIRSLEQSGILPKDTLFFSDPLPYGARPLEKRVVERAAWFSKSMSHLDKADVVFLDPDNGIQTQNVKVTQSRSIKYVLVDEVRAYCKRHDIVILYNHRDRSPEETYLERFAQLHKAVGQSMRLRIMRFSRVSVRHYVFLFKRDAISVVQSLFEVLGREPYSFLFEEVGL